MDEVTCHYYEINVEHLDERKHNPWMSMSIRQDTNKYENAVYYSRLYTKIRI